MDRSPHGLLWLIILRIIQITITITSFFSTVGRNGYFLLSHGPEVYTIAVGNGVAKVTQKQKVADIL